MTLSVPLPCELKASMVRGLKTAPSLLPARGRVVMILPSTALRITQVGVPPLPPRHIAKRMWFLVSMARPAGPLPFLTEVEMAGHLEGIGVHHGDVVSVGYVKIEMPLAVRDALLDGGIGAVRADGLHLADDRAVLGIDHEEVGRR